MAAPGDRGQLPVLHSVLMGSQEVWPFLSWSLSYGLERGGRRSKKKEAEKKKRKQQKHVVVQRKVKAPCSHVALILLLILTVPRG